MRSRFLSGLAAGAVVSGLILATVSVLPTNDAPGHGPQAGGVDVPIGSGFSQVRDDTVARLPQPDAVQKPAFGTAPVSAAPPDDLSKVAGKGTTPAGRPEISAPQTDLTTPAVIDESSGMTQPLVSNSAVGATAEQTGDATRDGGSNTMSISSDPAQPDMPEIEGAADYDAATPTPDQSAIPSEADALSADLPQIPADPAAPDRSNRATGVTDTGPTEHPRPTVD